VLFASGKLDNMLANRTVGVELKGGKHKPTHVFTLELNTYDSSVLLQSLQRAYSMSCAQGYVGSIGVFAVCSDKVWLVWFKREFVSPNKNDAPVLTQSFHVMGMNPDDLGEMWAVLAKEAVENPNVFYLDNKDARFLNSIYPNLAH
jgi:hypothetical protein